MFVPELEAFVEQRRNEAWHLARNAIAVQRNRPLAMLDRPAYFIEPLVNSTAGQI